MKITMLGCGGSGGVPLAGPVPGGDWGRCDPAEPRNRRRRPSILIEHDRQAVLVDASPDLRDQLLDAAVTRLDAVLFTHAHADHCHGIDELRWLAYARGEAIPAFMDEATHSALTARFGYVFTSCADPDSLYQPMLDDRIVGERFEAGGLAIEAIVQDHGPQHSLGFRIGDFAYSTDVVELSEEAMERLAGIKVWIVDCLRDRPHPTHAHFAKTLAWIERLRPERAVFTHMNHQFDYAEALARCPRGVEPGYDGLTLELA